MLSLVAGILSSVGSFIASIGTTGCILIYIDEPECPKSLIK